ncbi:MAG TPA: polysaccharide biosynthesis/export family protein [Tepidisphaeraceae bacterium]|nr:polysaccharide biosynthesis/export family protein [Tepidisphaeraceae bacterium]
MRLPRISSPKSKKLTAVSSAAALAVAALLGGGCNSNSFLDPSELTRGGESDRLTVKIIDEIEPVAQLFDPEFPAAEEPRPEDLQATITDYTMGPGDVVDVAVTDLTGQGIETVNTRQITESGNIILPLLKQPVRAEGLTEQELAQAVAEAYRTENIIQEAQVSTTLRLKRNRTYEIRGAIAQPGEYEITKSDFRLLNALVQARDIPGGQAVAVDDIFIIRKVKSDPSSAAPGTNGAATAPSAPADTRDPLAPQSRLDTRAPAAPAAQTQNQPAPGADAPTAANTPATVPAPGETEGRFIIVDGKPVQVGAQQPPPDTTGAAQTTRTSPQAAPQTAPPGPGAGTGGGFTFNAPEAEGETRVIRIPFDALRNGELKYNVVIRPQDMIIIPEPQVKSYFMGGHVAAPGAYTMIPGNKLTLMEAVISARMLDGLAIPSRTDLIRRNGDVNTWVRVDLDKIFAGQHPDIYLRENDKIMVGTNVVAPFLAAFRNAFRVTYGFGFLYDRNFAAEENNRGLRR